MEVDAEDAGTNGWLRDAGGVLYHNQNASDETQSWAALVRTPRAAGRTGKLILAFGESRGAAVAAARERWQEVWTTLSGVH